MATWDTVLVERLRYYINDIDSTSYTWTDLQLQKFLAIAAINTITDLTQWGTTINGPYTIDTSVTGSAMISPDPLGTVLGFSNLIVLNAACILAKADLKKTGAAGGWKITDDKSSIDGTQAVNSARLSMIDYCDSYKNSLLEFKEGNKYAGSAILSPYNSYTNPFNINSLGVNDKRW